MGEAMFGRRPPPSQSPPSSAEDDAARAEMAEQIQRAMFPALITTGPSFYVSALGCHLNISFERDHIDPATVVNVVCALKSIPASARPNIADSIFAHYLKEIADGSADFATAQHQLDWEAENGGSFSDPKAAETASDVWRLIRLETIYVGFSSHRWPGQAVATVGGRCAWDDSHGIGLLFPEGRHLARVQDYSGTC